MGLFNEVVFEKDNPLLPAGYPADGWQTKDLENYSVLSTFGVLKDGRIVRFAPEYGKNAIVKIHSHERPNSWYFCPTITVNAFLYVGDYELTLQVVNGFVVRVSEESEEEDNSTQKTIWKQYTGKVEIDFASNEDSAEEEQDADSIEVETDTEISDEEALDFYTGPKPEVHPDNGKAGFWLVVGIRHSALVQTDSATKAVEKADEIVYDWELSYVKYLGDTLPEIFNLSNKGYP